MSTRTLAANDVLMGRLAALPRLRGGTPVPYIVEWTSWRKNRVQDPAWGWVDNCECIPGLGNPLLTEVCEQRQREVMTRRACQMCGQPIEDEPFCFLHSAAGGYVHEPPFHAACGRWAFTVCPGMLRITRDGGQKYGKPVLVAECDTYTLAGYLGNGEMLLAADAPLTLADRRAVRNLYAEIPVTAPAYPLCDWIAGTP